MAALLPLVQPIGPLAQLEPRFPSAAHSVRPPLRSPRVTIPLSSQGPAVSSAQISRPPLAAAAKLAEDVDRSRSGHPPNCAGMPATKADTNMPNHIIRDPATDCMK